MDLSCVLRIIYVVYGSMIEFWDWFYYLESLHGDKFLIFNIIYI